MTQKQVLVSGLDPENKKFHAVDGNFKTCPETWNAQLPLNE